MIPNKNTKEDKNPPKILPLSESTKTSLNISIVERVEKHKNNEINIEEEAVIYSLCSINWWIK